MNCASLGKAAAFSLMIGASTANASVLTLTCKSPDPTSGALVKVELDQQTNYMKVEKKIDFTTMDLRFAHLSTLVEGYAKKEVHTSVLDDQSSTETKTVTIYSGVADPVVFLSDGSIKYGNDHDVLSFGKGPYTVGVGVTAPFNCEQQN